MGAKPLLVLFVFVLLLSLFAKGMLGNKDLTPRTPYVAPSNQALAPGQTGGGAAALPATTGSGYCGSPYTVQSGDTLSSIARRCGITLQALCAANPAIPNHNLIFPGQQIHIPGAVASVPLPAPTAVPTATQPAPAPSSSNGELDAFQAAAGGGGPTPAPRTSARPGDEIEVLVQNLPPNTRVAYGLGQVGAVPEPVGEATTGADGTLRVKVRIPISVLGTQQWTVTVTGIDDPQVKVTAEPVEIRW